MALVRTRRPIRAESARARPLPEAVYGTPTIAPRAFTRAPSGLPRRSVRVALAHRGTDGHHEVADAQTSELPTGEPSSVRSCSICSAAKSSAWADGKHARRMRWPTGRSTGLWNLAPHRVTALDHIPARAILLFDDAVPRLWDDQHPAGQNQSVPIELPAIRLRASQVRLKDRASCSASA